MKKKFNGVSDSKTPKPLRMTMSFWSKQWRRVQDKKDKLRLADSRIKDKFIFFYLPYYKLRCMWDSRWHALFSCGTVGFLLGDELFH